MKNDSTVLNITLTDSELVLFQQMFLSASFTGSQFNDLASLVTKINNSLNSNLNKEKGDNDE